MSNLRHRWLEYRPSKTEAFWTAAGVVAGNGRATMPDRKEPNAAVARVCAAQLLKRPEAKEL